jgi:hypothetical protein
MSTESGTAKSGLAGTRAGRFCPTCRSPMIYTGEQRSTEVGMSAEERCSTCGFTAWKRSVLGKDPAAQQRP